MKNTENLSTTLVPGAMRAERADAISGNHAWALLAIVWTIYLISCVDRLAWGNLSLSVGRDLHLPISSLGLFVTAFFVGYVISNVASGALCDAIGPRRLLAYAMIPMGFFTFVFGSVTSLAFGLGVQALIGLCAGADAVAGFKIISVWFDRRRCGRAMGIFLTGTSGAVIVTNIVVPRALALLGWGGVYHALGVVTALCGVLALFTLPELGRAPGKQPTADSGWSHLFADRTKTFELSMIALAGFGGFWGIWGFAFWANALMVKAAHLSPVRAGVIMASFGVGALVAKPLVGWLSDLLGGRRRGLAIVSFVAFAVSLVVFGHLRSDTAFNLIAPLAGVAAFAFSPLLYAIVTEASGAARAGAATGFATAFWQLGTLIVPVAVGSLFQATHSFSSAFVVLALGPALGMICLLFVREPQANRRSAP